MEKLVVKNLSHSFGDVKILDNINFTLSSGKITSILGSSGCGKTTLLQICAGLQNQTEGEVLKSFKKSSFVFQEPHLLPWQNLIDNISLPLKQSNLSKEEIVKKAQTIALKLGLSEDDFLKYPKDLSGGMKQRVSLARALVVEPTLLFLDEPFSALDIVLKKELYAILQTRVKKESLSILFITHDLMEAVVLSDETLVMQVKPNGCQIIDRYMYDLDFNKRDDEFIYKHILSLSNKLSKEEDKTSQKEEL